MDISQNRRFLFSAILGQDKLKAAYLANIVNPGIGGLLISGPKGTGKSTIVHSVESILPERKSVEDCIFNCDPDRPVDLCSICRDKQQHPAVSRRMRIINLPLSCTEDRLIGSIDIEKLLKTGQKVILPGILGQANGNILYVDEVNLLPDHLVDDILDAASTHWNTIEREGISVFHPADFVLVGTMNPEEGDLRPQILDRFPLCVKIETVKEPGLRTEIVKNNLLFEKDRQAFYDKFKDIEETTRKKIIAARRLIDQVSINDAFIESVASSCATLKVDGQRPDIVIVKTAMTLAALDGRTEVGSEDILLASELALIHRTRDGGLLEPPTVDEIEDNLKRNLDKNRENISQKQIKQKVEVAIASGAVEQESQKKNEKL
jgi:Mg-chelatase subunit ChlI